MRNSSSKLYYKISEASEILGVPPSTLRFWEREFHGTICPHRSDRGTRYYTDDDLEAFRMIKFLIKDRGLKVEAARQEIRLNRDGVAKKAEAIRTLGSVRDRLQGIIDAMHQFR
ncbi:MAG: MerR family transcriptional regulator [Duncaniella sp.]|nr:MerR family transcriptional regulator [Duncaniella sp.]